jgi:hypothetical protein
MSGLNFFGKVRDMVGYGEMGDEDLVVIERKREGCANGGHVAGASSEN